MTVWPLLVTKESEKDSIECWSAMVSLSLPRRRPGLPFSRVLECSQCRAVDLACTATTSQARSSQLLATTCNHSFSRDRVTYHSRPFLVHLVFADLSSLHPSSFHEIIFTLMGACACMPQPTMASLSRAAKRSEISA